MRAWLNVFVTLWLGCAGCHTAGGGGGPARDEPAALGSSVTALPWSAQDPHVCVVVPSETINIHATTGGRVLAVLVNVGDAVATDDPVLKLDDRTLSDGVTLAETRLLEAKAAFAARRQEVAQADAVRARAQNLVKAGVIPDEKLEDAAAEAELARRNAAGARATVASREAELLHVKRLASDALVRAPGAGVVASRLVEPGSAIAAGTLLLRIVASGTMKVRCAVPAGKAAALQGRESVDIRIGDAKFVQAAVTHVAPEVDAVSQLVIVESALPASASAMPGTAAWMRAH